MELRLRVPDVQNARPVALLTCGTARPGVLVHACCRRPDTPQAPLRRCCCFCCDSSTKQKRLSGGGGGSSSSEPRPLLKHTLLAGRAASTYRAQNWLAICRRKL